MALPIRRATPQPRPKPIRPQRITPAPLGSPQAAAVLAWRGHVWIPRPRITVSRLVAPAPVVAAVVPPGTIALQGIKRALQRPRITASRAVGSSPLASAQATPTFAVLALKHLPTKPLRSRFVIPAASVAATIPPATLALQGVRRPTGKPPRARLIVAPLGTPQAASTNVVGIRRPTGKPPRPRVVVAPVGSSQAPGVNVAGIRRGPVRNSHSRFFVGIPPTITPTPATLPLHGARWAPIRIARSRRVVPAPPADPQAAATFITRGARRIHPKRAPQARLFVAPFVAAIVISPGTVGVVDQIVYSIGIVDRSVSTVGVSDVLATASGAGDQRVSQSGASDVAADSVATIDQA